jgi:hypothetical protein
MYDYSAEWAAHCSIQKVDYYKTAEQVTDMREQWGKPVVLDGIGYEGDLEYEWGSLSAYTLKNSNSQLLLGIQGGSTADGAPAVQWTADGSANQQWQLVQVSGD